MLRVVCCSCCSGLRICRILQKVFRKILKETQLNANCRFLFVETYRQSSEQGGREAL